MPFSLTPRWVFQHYSEITPGWLRERGITLLLADLDNTLVPYGVPEPTEAVRAWNRALEEAGIRLHTIPSAELSRGRGGPRCMSMPLWRGDP